MPNPLRRAANASKASTAAMRSPYAAGTAKAAGNSGATTPFTRNASPINRNCAKGGKDARHRRAPGREVGARSIELRRSPGGKPRLWRHHWFRHTFETILKDDLEFPPWIVAAITNHAAKDLSSVIADYTHGDYLQQQKRWLDIWAKHIHDAAYPGGDDQTNVTPLHRRAESA
jgi:hypothetical protein